MSAKTVFISYRRDPAGSAFARSLAEKLTHHGYDVFLDVDRVNAGEWGEQILKEVESRAHFILVLTPGALDGCESAEDWVRREFAHALQHGRNIVPILEDSVDLAELRRECRPPMSRLFAFQVAQVRHDSYNAGIQNLIDRFIPATKAPRSPGETTGQRPGKEAAAGPPLPAFLLPPAPTPPRWWVAVAGWFAYRKAQAFRDSIFAAYRKDGLARPLVEGFKTEFQKLGRGNVADAPAKRVTIINGPVGVGKTTYLDHLFRKVLGGVGEASAVDLFIKLDTRSVEEAVRQNSHPRLWEAICAFFTEHAATTGQPTPSPAAIAYALGRKRVLLIVEDLHLAESSMAVLKLLAGYFERHHPKGGYSVLGTTREPQEKLPDNLVRDEQVKTLHPIGKEEAQHFFYVLCTDNGLPREKLTEHGDALHRAFSTKSLQTPLFVVICAWLAASEGFDVGQVLQMNTRELFDHFIDKLYKRSKALPADGDKSFRDLYEKLALALWPVGENFDERDAARLLSELTGPGSPFDAETLEVNGFLRKDAPLKLSFPHQMMAEYLAAVAMVRHLQFGRLRENSQYAPVEGLVPFLAELIKPPEARRALESLAWADPLAFIEVATLQANPQLLPSGDIAAAVAEWATPRAPRRLTSETWERLRDILDSTRSAGWVEKFCSKVVELSGKATGAGVEALAIVGREAADTYFVDWLIEYGEGAFREAVEMPQVQESLLRVVKRAGIKCLESAGRKTTLGQLAFGVLASCRERAVRKRLVELAAQELARLVDKDYEALIDLGKDVVGVLGCACEHKDMRRRKYVSSQCAYHMRKNLLPLGDYAVVDENGREVTVTVKRPVLIPCLPERAGNQTSSQMQALVGRKGGIKKLMTKEQALILHQHFSHVLQEKFGPSFPDAARGEYEALRDGEKVGLFYFYEDKPSGRMKLGSTNEHYSGRVQVGREVLYRTIEEL
ncbi:MAG TPA: TIR domain-containing protein [Pyrinomonadaceae bacterium]|jgi:hypothetical protein